MSSWFGGTPKPPQPAPIIIQAPAFPTQPVPPAVAPPPVLQAPPPPAPIPAAPPLSPAAEVPPTERDEEEQRKRRVGRAATILTGPRGLLEPAPVARKSLLGG